MPLDVSDVLDTCRRRFRKWPKQETDIGKLTLPRAHALRKRSVFFSKFESNTLLKILGEDPWFLKIKQVFICLEGLLARLMSLRPSEIRAY